MDLNYKNAESNMKPLDVEISKHTAFIRKDIVEDIRIIDGESIVFYTYKEAKLSINDFNEYLNSLIIKNAIESEKTSGNITNIVSGQENSDSNQLAIMEAIADLYDMISSNK